MIRLQTLIVLSIQEKLQLCSNDANVTCLHENLAEDRFAKCIPSVPGTTRG